MTAVECSPNHFTLDVAHPLAHELHKSLFGDQTRRRTQLHDIYNLMEQPKLFRRIVHFLSERYRAMGAEGPTHILGLESRGYLLGVPLAMELGLPFVAARVTKRFPSSFIDEGGSLKQLPSSRSIRNASIPQNARVVVVDDFIGTGHTMTTALCVMDIIGARVLEAVTLCDIVALSGVDQVHNADDGYFRQKPIVTLVRFHSTMQTAEEQLRLVNQTFSRSHM
ncbi:Phosphoribosyl transferase domain [Trypanosoma vivax]|nr:Phosphoribosyl transferase domain [Trypanosoma vivax]